MLSSLESIVERLVKGYDPDRIILFGSRAAGHGAADSDFDLLVYTPSELRTLYASGSPFIEEVFRTGRVVFMRKPTQAWMAQARDEFETADILLSSEKYQAVCYHSQQCVEKALKALDTDEAVFLNSVYRGRYPTEEGLLPHGEPTHADAQRAHAAARTLVESVEAVLAPSAESA